VEMFDFVHGPAGGLFSLLVFAVVAYALIMIPFKAARRSE